MSRFYPVIVYNGSMELEIPVQLTAPDGRTRRGSTRVARYDRPARLKKAIRIALIGLGLSFASLFLPLLHWVLVPALFIGSGIAAAWTYRQSGWIMEGRSECPACNAPFVIAQDREHWPLMDRCTHCFQDIRINPMITNGDMLDGPA